MEPSPASYELVHAYADDAGDVPSRVVRASLPSRKLGRRIEELARDTVPVLIVGETGTGKTLLANELRSKSGTGERDLSVSCASLKDTQLAQLVFDYLPAHSACAPRGSLFIDEVGELNPWSQAVLLRALSDRDPSAMPRLISTTSRDLDALVGAGTFSAELLLRLRGVTLALPPLRERVPEINALALHFLRLSLRSQRLPVISLDPRVINALEQHPWPGNIRELRNTLSSAVAACVDGYLRLDCLPEELKQREGTAS